MNEKEILSKRMAMLELLQSVEHTNTSAASNPEDGQGAGDLSIHRRRHPPQTSFWGFFSREWLSLNEGRTLFFS
jgi:hypothetical protein